MHRLALSFAALLALGTLTVSPVAAQIIAVPEAMNFQGRLTKPDGTPVADGTYSIRFSLWSALTGGTEVWDQTLGSVAVKNGTFSVQLSALPAGTFNRNTWLEIKIGTDAPLTPRQPLVTVPYAFKAEMALTVPDGSITNAKIAAGAITADKFAANIFNPLTWLLGGNSGTNPASHFLGTTDNRPLNFRVNNRRAMQYSYAENTVTAGQEYRSINVRGGSEINAIGTGVVGATIAGGGIDYFTVADLPNQVLADFGTVGGGANNTVSGYYATVGGGYLNTASGQYATVGGSFFNTASGNYSTVGGGANNTASGELSFAAGRRAKANHNGTFVWGDSTNADFASTGINQFLIRANGGVGINTNDPAGNALNVNGTAQMTGFKLPTGAGMSLTLLSDAAGVGRWGRAGTESISDSAITSAKIANGAVRTEDIFDGAITSAKIAPNAVLALHIQGGLNFWGLDGNNNTNPDTQFIGTVNMQPLVFRTNATEKMRLLANGKLGIGTNTPASALHVTPTSGLTLGVDPATGNYTALQMSLSAVSSGYAQIQAIKESGTQYGNLIVNPLGGNVGIGTSAPNYKLQVNGTVAGLGNYLNLSDARYKTNVSTFPDALDAIVNLRGVTFDWKQNDFPDMNFTTGKQIGFLAQEVEKVLPELVTTDSKGYKSVAYANVVPVLVEAVKTQQKQIERLQKDNDTKAKRLADVEAKNVELEARLERLEAALRNQK